MRHTNDVLWYSTFSRRVPIPQHLAVSQLAVALGLGPTENPRGLEFSEQRYSLSLALK